MFFCAIEILQVGSFNLALFTWFSWVWYIPKSASCTRELFKSMKLNFPGMGRETFRPQALGQGFLPWRWIKPGSSRGFLLPSNVLLWCSAHCCSGPAQTRVSFMVTALLGEVKPGKQETAHARMIQPYFYQRSLFPYQTSEQRQKQGESVMIKPAHTGNASVLLADRNAS